MSNCARLDFQGVSTCYPILGTLPTVVRAHADISDHACITGRPRSRRENLRKGRTPTPQTTPVPPSQSGKPRSQSGRSQGRGARAGGRAVRRHFGARLYLRGARPPSHTKSAKQKYFCMRRAGKYMVRSRLGSRGQARASLSYTCGWQPPVLWQLRCATSSLHPAPSPMTGA